jgi:hypothetical protein
MYSNILAGACTHDGHNPPPVSLHLHHHPDNYRLPSHLYSSQLLHKAHESSTNNINVETKYSKYDQSCCKIFKRFWSYSKPCGILTLILGFLCLVSSITCFVIVYGTKYCLETDDETHQSCSSQFARLVGISFLIFSIFFIFFGTVIVIYSTRDKNANIIVTSNTNKNGYKIKKEDFKKETQQESDKHTEDRSKASRRNDEQHTTNNKLSLINEVSQSYILIDSKNTPFIDSDDQTLGSF